MRVGGLLAAVMLGACASGAPDTPSPYPPTVKSAVSSLVFDGTETCDNLRVRFGATQAAEAHYAKTAAIQHYELGPMTVVMMGINVLAFNQTTARLAESRGNLLALRLQMEKVGCENLPEVVFSTPSAREYGRSTP